MGRAAYAVILPRIPRTIQATGHRSLVLPNGADGVVRRVKPRLLKWSIEARSYTVGSWLANSYQTVGDQSNDITGVIDLSAVSDPAPEAVYQTYTLVSGPAGNRALYQLPVPDGDYQLRLHFVEPSVTTVGSRRFDILLQDILDVASGIRSAG